MSDLKELKRAAKLFERHTFEQSRGNPRFVVRSSGIIETFADSDAETLNKVLAQFPAIVAKLEAAKRLRDAAKTAPNILEHMIMTSENGKCPPLHYLLTHEGLYGFHMANLWVRNDGKEYTISADWADNCGRLVKHLTEALAAFDKEQQ